MPANEHVHNLTVLVDGPLHVPPATVDLHIRLINEPAVTDGMPSRPGRIDQLRSEPTHPPKQREVIQLYAALGE